jgi:hypothetical protein
MRESRRGGSRPFRGIVGYPLEQLYEEAAFIASHFHWSETEILAMEHWERRQWCEEISRMNRTLNENVRTL